MPNMAVVIADQLGLAERLKRPPKGLALAVQIALGGELFLPTCVPPKALTHQHGPVGGAHVIFGWLAASADYKLVEFGQGSAGLTVGGRPGGDLGLFAHELDDAGGLLVAVLVLDA